MKRFPRIKAQIAIVCVAAATQPVLAGPGQPEIVNSQASINAMNQALQRNDCNGAVAEARQILARWAYGTVEAAQANLAIGSCLLRAKRWSAAQRALRLARPLPGRAAQTRRRLEKYAADRERDELRSAGSGTTVSPWSPVGAQPYWQNQAPVVMPVEPAYGKVPQKPKPQVDKSPKPGAVANSFSVTPSVTYSRTDSALSYSGLSRKGTTSLITEQKVNFQARSESPVSWAKGDSLALSLPVELNNRQESASNELVSFRRDSDSATTVFGTVSPKGKSSKYFLTTLTPAMTLPLTGSVEFEGSLLYSMTTPEAGAEKETRLMPSGAIDVEAGAWKLSGGATYDQRLDPSDSLQKSSLAFTGNVSFAAGNKTWTLALARTDTHIPDTLRNKNEAAANTTASLTGKIGTESADYKFSGIMTQLEPFPVVGMNAPGLAFGFGGDVDIPVGVFSVGGSFSWSNLSDILQTYTIKDDQGEVSYNVAAEATRTKFGGRLQIMAIKGLALSLNYSYVNTDYTTNNPAVQKEFLRSNEDLKTETTINAAISREF